MIEIAPLLGRNPVAGTRFISRVDCQVVGAGDKARILVVVRRVGVEQAGPLCGVGGCCVYTTDAADDLRGVD